MRYLHTMLRVRDLDAALDFFVAKLGLREQRRQQNEAGRFTLVFLGTGAAGDRRGHRTTRSTTTRPMAMRIRGSMRLMMAARPLG